MSAPTVEQLHNIPIYEYPTGHLLFSCLGDMIDIKDGSWVRMDSIKAEMISTTQTATLFGILHPAKSGGMSYLITCEGNHVTILGVQSIQQIHKNADRWFVLDDEYMEHSFDESFKTFLFEKMDDEGLYINNSEYFWNVHLDMGVINRVDL